MLPSIVSASLSLTLMASPVPDLSGTWVAKHVTTSVSDLPVIGEVVSAARSLIVYDVTQEGDRVRFAQTVCQIDVRSSPSLVKTILPEAFTKALSGAIREARLVRKKGAVHLVSRPLWEVHGASLDAAQTDPLPRSTEDPRLRDTDGDGQPGLTIRVEGFVDGELYVVHRGWTAWAGTVIDRDTFEVKLLWDSEQSIVGTTHKWLDYTPPTSPHRNGSLSYLRARRAEPSVGCREFLAAPGRHLSQTKREARR